MKPHEEWLLKAAHDIESSELLFAENKDLIDIAIYHTQQCAEKSLKAFLAYKELDLEKTHNLIILVNMCMKHDPEFKNIMEDAIFLNPYSTLFRYPESELVPTSEETEKAIQCARSIHLFVKNKII
jgi:HEPN domain-containing protein